MEQGACTHQRNTHGEASEKLVCDECVGRVTTGFTCGPARSAEGPTAATRPPIATRANMPVPADTTWWPRPSRVSAGSTAM
jgi:hypothetical protein